MAATAYSASRTPRPRSAPSVPMRSLGDALDAVAGTSVETRPWSSVDSAERDADRRIHAEADLTRAHALPPALPVVRRHAAAHDARPVRDGARSAAVPAVREGRALPHGARDLVAIGSSPAGAF